MTTLSVVKGEPNMSAGGANTAAVCGAACAASARALTSAEQAESARLFDVYQNYLRANRGKAEATIEREVGFLRWTLAHVSLPPWEWRERDLEAFISYLALDRGNCAASQLNRIYTLRGFQNFLLGDVGLCSQIERTFGARPQAFITATNSIPYRRKGHERVKIIAPLTAEYVAQLVAEFDFRIEQARKAGLKSYAPLRRDKTMTQLALLTGARIEELINIRISDFLPDAAYPEFGDFAILRVIGKGAKGRAIRLFNPAVREILEWYMKEVRPRFLSSKTQDPSLLFLSERGGALCKRQFRRSLGEVGRAAGLPMRVHPHLLRHTYATQMAPIIGPEALQKQLGHKFLSTTLGYYYHIDPATVGNEVLLGIEKMTAMLDTTTRDL